MMGIIAPFQDKFLKSDGNLSKTWYRWAQLISREFGDLSGKADKISGATAGNIVEVTSGGNIADSGIAVPTGTVVTINGIQSITNKTYEGIAGANLLSRAVDEAISGTWHFKKKPSVTYTSSQTLTTSVFGKVIKVDNGVNSVTITLPSVGSGDIDGWYTIMRLGTGELTIQAADSDTIESSQAGGKIVCNEAGRIVANMTLYLATETKWAIVAATGIWSVV